MLELTLSPAGDLEYQTGDVETQIAFSTDFQENWYNVLAVAVDDSSDGSTHSGSSLTLSHSTNGDNRLMLVGVATDPHGESVASITYNGVNLTLVGAEEGSGLTFASRNLVTGCSGHGQQ